MFTTPLNGSMLSVVIPCYNTRDSLKPLYDRLIRVFEQVSINYEIIFVDDASPQEDWVEIEKLCKIDERVKLLKLVKNSGQQTAISAGLRHSKGDWVVVMDADLQDKPEDISALIAKIADGYPIVSARRTERKVSPLKRLYSQGFHWFFKLLTGISTDRTIGNFGIYRRDVIDTFLSLEERFRGFGLLLAWMGYKRAYIEVTQDKREIGKTSYNMRKGIALALDAIIAFSYRPLKFTALAGFGISLFSALVGLFFLIRGLLGRRMVAGWTSMMVSLWFLAGIIIMILGIMGLYIGKIFEETKKRPHYIVEKAINF